MHSYRYSCTVSTLAVSRSPTGPSVLRPQGDALPSFSISSLAAIVAQRRRGRRRRGFRCMRCRTVLLGPREEPRGGGVVAHLSRVTGSTPFASRAMISAPAPALHEPLRDAVVSREAGGQERRGALPRPRVRVPRRSRPSQPHRNVEVAAGAYNIEAGPAVVVREQDAVGGTHSRRVQVLANSQLAVGAGLEHSDGPVRAEVRVRGGDRGAKAYFPLEPVALQPAPGVPLSALETAVRSGTVRAFATSPGAAFFLPRRAFNDSTGIRLL